MSDHDHVAGPNSPDRDLTPVEREAMERATATLHEDIRALLADPARRAARGPVFADRRAARDALASA
jgi:hypothetical protein